MKRKIYAILLALTLILSLAPGGDPNVDQWSPYSNIVKIGMPAFYKAASSWAATELDKAAEYGLIPGILQGADMTKPITREEFCELALLLYEKTTGKTPSPASPNPFTDTQNPQILKAFALGITKGTSPTAFTPAKTVSRQECATMLYRAIRVIAPDADYSIAGVRDFPDQKDIDSWAVEGTKYMSKMGIIKGDSRGYFMPKPGVAANEAAGYGTATREAAVLMTVRSYETVDKAGAYHGEGEIHVESGESAELPYTPADTDADADAGAQAGRITGNELLLINDIRFIKGEYTVKAGGDNTFIFIPLERFRYAFKRPYAGNNVLPIVQEKDGKIQMKWKNAENEADLTVDLELDKPRAFINNSDVNIIEAPYESGEDIMIPVNIFVELFEMEADFFQSLLCLQNKQDFPADILVGTWSRSQTNVLSGYQDILTGAVSLPSYATNWRFDQDGTYRLATVSGGTYEDTYLLQKGKYKIIGNTVIRYEVLETVYKGNPFQLWYKDRQMNFLGGPYDTVFINDYNADNGKIKLGWDWYQPLETED